MKLELNEKIFIAPKAKARLFRKALEITKGLDLSSMPPEKLDEMLQFVVEIFGEKFSIDDIYDHIDSSDLLDLIGLAINHVMGGIAQVESKKKIVE